MNTSKVLLVELWFILWIAALLSIMAWVDSAKNTPIAHPDNVVQSKVDIYHHFSVYSTRINGVVYVVEIDVDSTLPYACDGWIAAEDNGHNCAIVGTDEITLILTDYHLLSTYPNVKGE